MQSDDFTKIVLTSGLTIVGGVVIYVAGQIVTRFFIDPYYEYRKIVGEVADALIYHANLYMNPGGSGPDPRAARMDETSNILRQKASLLRVRAHASPCYRLFSWCRLVPSWELILKASGALFGLSNNIREGSPRENAELRDEIIEALRLPSLR